MKQMTSGMLALVGALALAGCYSYASEAINNTNYNTVQATPQFALTKVGDSNQVLVRLVNDANVGAITSYTVSNVGAGIAVHYQQHYRPVYDATLDTLVDVLDKNQQQYYVVGVLPGKWTFTLTPTLVNTGISTTVTVLVSADSLRNATLFSKTTGFAAGDTLTITAPANMVFAQSSVFSFQVGPAPALVGVSADSTTARLLVAPGDSGKLTVTKVGLSQSPASPVATLTSSAPIEKVPAVTVAPTTASTLTPALGTTMTVQLGNNLRFLNSSHVFIGGREAGVVSVSADSSTATIVPMTGSTGNVTYTNIALSFLTGVPLALPGDKSITVGSTYSGPTDANAGAAATASTITLTGSRSTLISDNGPFVTSCSGVFGAGAKCRWYKVAITATAMSGELRWNSSSSADMGIYLMNAAGTSCLNLIADEALNQAGGPEIGSSRTCAGAAGTPAAGTITVAIVEFGGSVDPTWYQFRISQP
jgi:hypothetical protein